MPKFSFSLVVNVANQFVPGGIYPGRCCFTLASLICFYKMVRNSNFRYWQLTILNHDSLESVTITHDVAHWSLYRFVKKVNLLKKSLL